MAELLSLSYSPWSERARWALDHHDIEYRKAEYVPIFGAPLLRARLRKLNGNVTVPAFFDGEVTLTDSWDIARHADSIGGGPTLFPEGKDEEVSSWNDRAERILSAGRAAAILRTDRDPQAQKEALKGIVPKPLRGVFRPLAKLGAIYLANKYYDGPLSTENDLRSDIRDALASLADALGQGQFVFDAFSYADIVMAVSLQFVAPVANRYIKIGDATRRCWTDPELCEEFSALVDWRDRLYSEYR